MGAGGSRGGATAIACAGPFADDPIANPPGAVLAFAGGTAGFDNRAASATGALWNCRRLSAVRDGLSSACSFMAAASPLAGAD